MPFEHENQFYKRAATHSNYRNVLQSCANAKARMHVLNILKQAISTPTLDDVSGEGYNPEMEAVLAEAVLRYGFGHWMQ